jgi:hypothetical protein
MEEVPSRTMPQQKLGCACSICPPNMRLASRVGWTVRPVVPAHEVLDCPTQPQRVRRARVPEIASTSWCRRGRDRGAAEVLIQAVMTSTGERVDIQLFGDTDRDLNVPRDQPRPK